MQRHFLCSSCLHLLIDPKVVKCGHRYCSLCLNKIIKNDDSAVCPVENCGQTIAKDTIYNDFGIENDLKRLNDVICYNKLYGCLWRGTYVSYREHLKTCTYQRLECEYCSQTFTNRSLFEQHYPICPQALVLCPLKKFGCDVQIRRQDLKDHIQSSLVRHLQIIADAFSILPNQSSSIRTPTFENIDVASLQNELTRLNEINDRLFSEHKTLRATLSKRERELARVSVELQLFKGELCQLRKEYELSKSLIYNDGTYLWRIENVKQLLLNAKNSAHPLFITSPSFYTSKYGYKICLKLYANGDKTVRNEYLSVYITIMRGEYDSLLSWPFQYPVTICLYDRSSQQDHVVRTITPDLNSDCFQQPKMDANKSGGIPDFCPLCKIVNKDFGYVQQDTMFIKAFVDFNILPTNVWPHWTKLQTHGLPTNIEHIKLREIMNTKS